MLPCYPRTVLAIALSALFFSGCEGTPPRGTFQGYVEGDFLYLASPAAGYLRELPVKKGTSVPQGAELFNLSPEPDAQELTETERRLVETRATSQLAKQKLLRTRALFDRRAVSQESLDEAQASHDASAARVASTEAALSLVRWRLEQKTQRAPSQGTVIDTLYYPGEWVPQGAPVVSFLPPARVKIRFFVPEGELSRVRLGGRVSLTLDGRQSPIEAQVSFISPQAEYTPPIIYSNESRSKLVFMVEALPASPDALTLHPGQPVTVQLLD